MKSRVNLAIIFVVISATFFAVYFNSRQKEELSVVKNINIQSRNPVLETTGTRTSTVEKDIILPLKVVTQLDDPKDPKKKITIIQDNDPESPAYGEMFGIVMGEEDIEAKWKKMKDAKRGFTTVIVSDFPATNTK